MQKLSSLDSLQEILTSLSAILIDQNTPREAIPTIIILTHNLLGLRRAIKFFEDTYSAPGLSNINSISELLSALNQCFLTDLSEEGMIRLNRLINEVSSIFSPLESFEIRFPQIFETE